jgi:UDP-GlcNAc:undecaprenyl-phosphate GlcNAc-1-phosphate transferase
LIQLIVIFCVSFIITALSTPLVIKISFKLDILDYPADPLLKIHKKPMPLLGGIAMLVGIITSLIIIGFLYETYHWQIIGLFIALLFILSLGLFDDIKGLKPFVRLIGQIFAALIIIVIGKVTVNFIPFWYVSIPLTVFFLLASINAINLLDGLDGLATGMTLIASGGFFVVFFLKGDTVGAAISLALLGVTAGFLIFNFHPAKIFLGDNGSTVLGLLLGVLAVRFASEPYFIIHLVVPILILIVPLLDTSLAIGRRILKHRSISSGDRDHYYDKLVKKGLTQKQTSFASYLFGLLGAIAATSCLLIFG